MTFLRYRVLPVLRTALWPALVMTLLFAVSSVPARPNEHEALLEGLFSRIPPMVHNALHVPGYALLAWTLYLPLGRRLAPGVAVAAAVATATAYGALLEWHQMGVPGRYASAGDIVLNLFGALAGALLARRFTPGRRGQPTARPHPGA